MNDGADSLVVLYIGRRSSVADELQGHIAIFCGAAGSTAAYLPLDLHFQRVSSQRAALQSVRTEPPNVVLLEVNSRANSLLRFCETIRYRLPRTILYAVGEHLPDGLSAFDGFIPLPLDGAALPSILAELQGRAAGYQLHLGPIGLNLASRTVITPKGRFRTTPKQCALLQLLMENHDSIVTRSTIMQTIWNTTYMADTRTLDVHIRWLRERIEPDPSAPIYLETIRGVGYRLILP